MPSPNLSNIPSSNLIFLPPPSPLIFHFNTSPSLPTPTTIGINNISTYSNDEQLNLNLLNSLLIKHFQQNNLNLPQCFAQKGNINYLNKLNEFKYNNGQQKINETVNGQQTNNDCNNSAFVNNKIEIPIQNFLPPNNIVLLPVGCHSLPDERHIQLLGSPQTIIPIAVHSKILNNFPINPILLESSASSKILFGNCCKLNSFNEKQQKLLCHIPIAINKTTTQINISPKKEQKINNFMDVSCQTDNLIFPPSTCGDKNNSSDSNSSGIEPLDLSISSSNDTSINLQQQKEKYKQQYLRKRASTTTSKDFINKNDKEEITKKARKELIIINQKSTNSASSFSSNISNNYQNVNYENNIKNNDETKIKTSPKKRFPCDLCGDVSFLAMETLEGHRKYYCRNRKILPVDTSTQLTINNNIEGKEQQNNLNNLITIQQKHQKNLPLICVSCGYKSFNLKGLRNHLRSSHSIRTHINISPPSCVVEIENGETKEFSN